MLVPLLFLTFQSDLDALLDNPKLSGAIVSCTVVDEAGAVLYSRNPETRMMPASNQKLLSNSFALHKLGPSYRPLTRIWRMKDRIVVDSLGDPMMTHERLQSAAKTLGLFKNRPVHVRQAYRPIIPPSWEWDDLPNKYAAPVTAFTVDRGSIELWAKGESLSIRPFNYGLRPRRGEKSGKREVLYDPIRRSLTVSGDLPAAETRIDTLALPDPDAIAASYLGRSFAITSQVPDRNADFVITGPSLREAIKECLVKSDNNIAENLLLMAAAKDGPLGKDPYGKAQESLRHFLVATVGAAPGDFHPEDGSGLSRHDLVTTRGIVKLLQWAMKQPTKEAWLDALVKPGAGTLSDRLKDIPFVGKTGTLDMVVALSGYVQTKKNRTLTVSLILNHFECGEREARAIADDFIKKLAQDEGFGTVSASSAVYEARTAHTRPHFADADRNRGPRHHGVDARQRADYRTKPDHALLHRAQRVALRSR